MGPASLVSPNKIWSHHRGKSQHVVDPGLNRFGSGGPSHLRTIKPVSMNKEDNRYELDFSSFSLSLAVI